MCTPAVYDCLGTPTELQIPVPWGHLAGLTWGPVDGHPVLCLHGWMDNANTFRRLVPLLPPDRRYIALELSGHGQSSHLPRGIFYDFNHYVIEVRRAMDALNYSRVTIIGHSMGGAIGGMVASLFPKMVDKLILLDSYGFFPQTPDQVLTTGRQTIPAILQLEQKLGAKVYSPEGALRRLLEANNNLSEESGRILLERGTKAVPGGVVYSRDIRATVYFPAFFHLEQCLAFMKDIQARVLTLIATDGFDKKKEAIWRSLVHGFKSSLKERYRLEWVKGNHCVHLNEPEYMAGIISNFLKENSIDSVRSRL